MTTGAAVKTVWLDNPPVNAVNAGIVETLWRELEDDLGDETRVVVLRGKRRAGVLGGRRHRRLPAGGGRKRPPGRDPAASPT